MNCTTLFAVSWYILSYKAGQTFHNKSIMLYTNDANIINSSWKQIWSTYSKKVLKSCQVLTGIQYGYNCFVTHHQRTIEIWLVLGCWPPKKIMWSHFTLAI